MGDKVVLEEHPGATDFGAGNLAALGAHPELLRVYS